MYKVRFHLAKGKNYLKWQIKDEEGKVIYYTPEEVVIKMINCKLINKGSTAEKIFAGDNKSVCAWIECEDYEVYPSNQYRSTTMKHKLRFNPKILPFWHVPDREYHNLDNCFIKEMETFGRSVGQV